MDRSLFEHWVQEHAKVAGRIAVLQNHIPRDMAFIAEAKRELSICEAHLLQGFLSGDVANGILRYDRTCQCPMTVSENGSWVRIEDLPREVTP